MWPRGYQGNYLFKLKNRIIWKKSVDLGSRILNQECEILFSSLLLKRFLGSIQAQINHKYFPIDLHFIWQDSEQETCTVLAFQKKKNITIRKHSKTRLHLHCNINLALLIITFKPILCSWFVNISSSSLLSHKGWELKI